MNKSGWFIAAIVWTIFLLFACFTPGSGEPGGFLTWIPHFDKFLHFVLFLIWTYAFLNWKSNASIKIWIIIIVTGIDLAIVTELIQAYFIPFRKGDVLDVLADLLGIFSGFYLAYRKL